MASRSEGLSLPSLRALTAVGLGLYTIAAGADAYFTREGLGGRPDLEGNPGLRALMEALGVGPALALAKIPAGLTLWFFAAWIGRAIHDDARWIEKIPTLPFLRRWMRSGDRCWIALGPLYIVAAAQLCGAFAWVWIKLR